MRSYLHITFSAHLSSNQICENLVEVLLCPDVLDRDPALSPLTCPLRPMIHKHQKQQWRVMDWVVNGTSVGGNQPVWMGRKRYDSNSAIVPGSAGGF